MDVHRAKSGRSPNPLSAEKRFVVGRGLAPAEIKKPDLKEEQNRSDKLFEMLDEPIVSVPKPMKTVKVADSASPVVEEYQKHLDEKKEIKAAPAAPVEPIQDEPIEADQPAPAEEPQPLIDLEEDTYRYIGEAFKTYIIIEKNEKELMLIDKHAAHERIIFERLKNEKGSGYSQLLLTPLTVTLNKIDYNAVISDLDVFTEAGFDIDDFGDGTVIVRSAPQYLPPEDIESSVIEMAGYLSENKKEIRSEKMEWIYANVSCRAAVKGGNKSTEKELIELARQVEDEDIRHCPHGRPVCIVLKKREVERMFGRVE